MNTTSRRDLLARSVAAAAAMSVAPAAAAATGKSRGTSGDFAVPPPAIITLPIVGSAKRFPIRRIYCVGRNYVAHVEELHNNVKEPPFFFQKQRDMIVQSGGKVRYPELTSDFEYETELVVAMKSGGMDIAPEDANNHIFGYAVGFDMTRRDRQGDMKKMQKPWEIGKSFEDCAPCSALTPASVSGFLAKGEIKLVVDGKVRQDSDLGQMIWTVPQIIAELSRQAEIRAGDLIYTGTPAGVGPVVRGDHMVGTIAGLATLTVDIV
jgi:fumarylpyruvate hydrolase